MSHKSSLLLTLGLILISIPLGLLFEPLLIERLLAKTPGQEITTVTGLSGLIYGMPLTFVVLVLFVNAIYVLSNQSKVNKQNLFNATLSQHKELAKEQVTTTEKANLHTNKQADQQSNQQATLKSKSKFTPSIASRKQLKIMFTLLVVSFYIVYGIVVVNKVIGFNSFWLLTVVLSSILIGLGLGLLIFKEAVSKFETPLTQNIFAQLTPENKRFIDKIYPLILIFGGVQILLSVYFGIITKAQVEWVVLLAAIYLLFNLLLAVSLRARSNSSQDLKKK